MTQSVLYTAFLSTLLTSYGRGDDPTKKGIPAPDGDKTPAAKPLEPEKLDLNVEGKNFSINGKKVALPAARRTLLEVLGKPSRVLEKLNTIYVWDEVGMFAYERPGGDRLISVCAALGDMKRFDFWPKKTFRGKLSLDGAAVTSDTTLDAINRAKKGSLLERKPTGAFRWTIDYKELQVTILTGKDGRFDKDGAIVEFVIEGDGKD